MNTNGPQSGDLPTMVRAGLCHGLGTLVVKAVRVIQELFVAWTFAIESSVDGWFAAYALACIPINLALHAYQPPLVAALARERGGGGRLPEWLGVRSLLHGFVGAILIGILAPAWFRLSCPDPAAEAAGRSALPFLVVAVVAGVTSITWNGVLQASERYFLAGVLPAFIPLGMAATLLAAPDPGITSLAFGFAAGAVLEAAISWWAARRCPPTREATLGDAGAVLPYSCVLRESLVLLPGVICASLVPLVDQYFATSVGGAGAIATLIFAQRLPYFLAGTLSLAVAAAGTTRLARASASDSGRAALLRAGAGVLLAGAVVVAAPLAVLAEPVTSLLFHRGAFLEEDVAAVATPSALLLLGLPFLLVRLLAMRGLTVAGRNREVAAIQALHLALVVVLNLVFAALGMELPGVAAASTIAIGCGAWVAWMRAR